MCKLLDDLEITEHPRLRKSPLTSVVCQLRFPRVLGLAEDAVRPIQKSLPGYPVTVTERGQELLVGGKGIQMGELDQIFRFRDVEQTWTASVGQGMVALETTAFGGFREFAERWCELADVVARTLDLKLQERIGLRFINELPVSSPGLDSLRELVEPHLLGIAGRHERTTDLLRSMQELRFRQELGVVTIRHGYRVRDDEAAVYLLDFDHYDETPQPLKPRDQVVTLSRFNDGSVELFRALVTKGAYQSFDPEDSS